MNDNETIDWEYYIELAQVVDNAMEMGQPADDIMKLIAVVKALEPLMPFIESWEHVEGYADITKLKSAWSALRAKGWAK